MPKSAIEVAASIVRDPAGRVLLAQRTARQVSAGFWELPGGKIAAGESPAQAAARELAEEIGIAAHELRPAGGYEHLFPNRRVRLHFFHVVRWSGSPRGSEGQRLAWVEPAAPEVGPVLPSNRRILARLGLPSVCAVADLDRAPEPLLAQLERALQAGLGLVQLRANARRADQRVQLARCVAARARARRARVLIAASALEAHRAGADGVHSTATELRRLASRPPTGLWAASCRDGADLARAVSLGADFAVLSPVRASASHPEERPLGFDGLRRLVAEVPIPVYAQGGLRLEDLDLARRAGACGIALSLDAYLAAAASS